MEQHSKNGNLPTAKEFAEKYSIQSEYLYKVMIEFAKLHVHQFVEENGIIDIADECCPIINYLNKIK